MVPRFRLGFVTGFALGYYLGARAGRERYDQLRRYLDRARDSDVVDKLKAAVDLGIERIRETIDHGTRQDILDLPGLSRN